MIVQVTGSRHARPDPHGRVIRATLLWATGAKGGRPGEGHELRDGLAGGADQICHRIAHEDFGWATRRFEAEWSECDPTWVDPIDRAGRCDPHHRRQRRDGHEYCPTAGFRRNQAMIDALAADEPSLSSVDRRKVVVGFPMPEKGSKGTLDCLARALHAGLPVLSVPLK